MVSTRPVEALRAEINDLLGRVVLASDLCREVRREFIDRKVREVPVADVVSDRVRLRADIVRVAGDNRALRIRCVAGEAAGWSAGTLNGYAVCLSDLNGIEQRHAVFSNGQAGFTVVEIGELVGCELRLVTIQRQPWRRPEREEKPEKTLPWQRGRSRRPSGRSFPARTAIRGHNH